jgi:hypothetical protein
MRPLKVQPTLGNHVIARTRAGILMSCGADIAVEALGYVALAHMRQASQDSDSDLARYWEEVVSILHNAKRKIGELK